MGEQTDAPNCPRCGSTDTVTEARTDIPGDAVHEYGCDDCLYVWGSGR